ncbi:MAG TPA: hemerythrin domain-containing protein, partial [Planctomycetota bacterium]|nr:hemerythrin domain-containing protein [Planctomycetota bacterium]
MERFFDFMGVHEHLDRALAAHQEALVGLELARAAEALAAYDRGLRAHIREEETYVLPLYEALVPGACDIEIYRGEHRRFEVLLDELAGRAATLAAEGGPRAAVVALFDREAVLKHLLEHHDLRERTAL